MATNACPLGGHLKYFYFGYPWQPMLDHQVVIEIFLYIGCPWQPIPGLHFARFSFKLTPQILRPGIPKQNKRKQLGTVQASWTLKMVI